MDSISTVASSPTPTIRKKGLCNFYEALQALAEGKRITRMDWQDANIYGFLGLRENIVCIMTYNEVEDKYEEHTWAIAYGDLFAEDWMVLD